MPKTASKLPYVQRLELKDGTIRYRGWTKAKNGKRIFSQVQDTERAAYNAAMAMAKQAAGSVAEGITLDQGCDFVLEELKTKRTEGSQRWYAGHLDAVRKLIPGDTPLHRITSATIEQFIRDRLREWAKNPVTDDDGKVVEPGRTVKPATVNADLRALHRVFAVAIRRGHTDQNPVRQVDRPRADAAAMDWFTEEEFAQLLGRVTDQAVADLMLLFALTGVRRSEAERLRVEHVRLRLGQLAVPGKNAPRIVPLSPDLETPLRRMIAAAGADGTLVVGGVAAIDKTFVTWRRQLKERRLHPHALRHTFGTALVRKGVRLDVVMRLMGHRSIKTTMRYQHEVGADGVEAVRRLAVLPRLGSGRDTSH